MNRLFFLPLAFALSLGLIVPAAPVGAQDRSFADGAELRADSLLSRWDEPRAVNRLGGARSGNEISLSAFYQVEKGGDKGRLSVRAELAPSWHVYSLTQPPGGPLPSEIQIQPSPQFEILGSFDPDRDPQIRKIDEFEAPVEEHYGRVTWTAPIRLANGADPSQLNIGLQFSGLLCRDHVSCIPLRSAPVAVSFAGFYNPSTPTGEHRPEHAHGAIRGYIEPQVAAPGDTIKLVLTAVPDPQWYVYAQADRDPEAFSKPTLIALTKTSGWRASPPAASAKASVKETGLEEEPVIYYHDEPVSWTIELEAPGDAPAGQYTVSGLIGYQMCTTHSCDPPTAAHFTVDIPVSHNRIDGQLPLAFSASTYHEAAELAAAQAPTSGRTQWDDLSLLAIFGLAFVAGLILNVMPCVLPVIGLKVMSFVQQAGESRLRIFALNMWFSLGLLSVFLLLATVAVFLKLGWGEHFASVEFSIALAAVVFVFALSFLGVWEIPIPGFVGVGKASELAQKEGAVGAFAKGVLATVLATPCTGPFLGPAVSWAIGQPAWLTYATFACIGLGMAFPYLVIGVFPKLIHLLPKPGAWMETFKQLMGFVLMGTVVWIFSFIEQRYIVPTLALLVGLGVACWIIGRTPLTAELGAKLRAWAAAGAVTVLAAWFSFGWLLSTSELPWQPFTRAVLEEHREQGRTVLVDFTARW